MTEPTTVYDGRISATCATECAAGTCGKPKTSDNPCGGCCGCLGGCELGYAEQLEATTGHDRTRPATPADTADAEAVIAAIHNPDGPRTPAQSAIHCDRCGRAAVHDYLVKAGTTQAELLKLGRKRCRAEGWRCDDAEDLCPSCKREVRRDDADHCGHTEHTSARQTNECLALDAAFAAADAASAETEAALGPYAAHRGLCRSCSAAILWTVTHKGSDMPVDAEPTDDGNVLLARQGAALVAGVLGHNQAAGARSQGAELHRSHFASCPDAARFRKTRR